MMQSLAARYFGHWDVAKLLVPAFVLVIITIVAGLDRGQNWRDRTAIRFAGLVTLGLLVVLVGAIVPAPNSGGAFGLLGTIAGYMVGRFEREHSETLAPGSTHASKDGVPSSSS